jgi:hypothetical protein
LLQYQQILQFFPQESFIENKIYNFCRTQREKSLKASVPNFLDISVVYRELDRKYRKCPKVKVLAWEGGKSLCTKCCGHFSGTVHSERKGWPANFLKGRKLHVCKFLVSFRYRKSANFLGVLVCIYQELAKIHDKSANWKSANFCKNGFELEHHILYF